MLLRLSFRAQVQPFVPASGLDIVHALVVLVLNAVVRLVIVVAPRTFVLLAAAPIAVDIVADSTVLATFAARHHILLAAVAEHLSRIH